jgi:hypothetical protein
MTLPDAIRDPCLAAVGLSVTCAIEAATRGEYADALRWLTIVEELGYEVSPTVHAKRRQWLAWLAAPSPSLDVLSLQVRARASRKERRRRSPASVACPHDYPPLRRLSEHADPPV